MKIYLITAVFPLTNSLELLDRESGQVFYLKLSIGMRVQLYQCGQNFEWKAA